jgi:hypothetical protein
VETRLLERVVLSEHDPLALSDPEEKSLSDALN